MIDRDNRVDAAVKIGGGGDGERDPDGGRLMHGGVLLKKMTEEATGTTLAVATDMEEAGGVRCSEGGNDWCKIVLRL
jgi:hypothetical protein